MLFEENHSTPLPLQLGTVFSKYKLLSKIAQGGMGIVYKAEKIDTQEIVALKVLLKENWSDSAEVKRFLREAQTASSINHPNIVRVQSVGKSQGYYYLEMPYIKGITFHDFLNENERLQPRLKIFVQVARALHAAHQENIVHRDIKPSNILLDQMYHPYLTDFGLAKSIVGENTLTQTGTVLGTPVYMSPEQADGSREIDHYSDIYSLGVLLYECLTNQLPFDEDNLSRLYHQIIFDNPTPPREINSRVSADLEKICLKAMAKNRKKRYASALVFARDVERVMTRRSLLSYREESLAQNRNLFLVFIVVCFVFLVLSFFPTLSTFSQTKEPLASLEKIHQLIEKKKYTAALAELKNRLEQVPSAEIFFLQSRVYQSLEKWSEAISAISQAIALEPSFSYFLERARIAFQVGYHDEIRKDLKKAHFYLKNIPQKARKKNLLSSLYQVEAQLAFVENDYTRAYEITQKVLERDSENSPALLLLGQSAYHLEKYSDALLYLNKTLQKKSLSSFDIDKAHFYRGVTQYKLDQIPLALKEFELVLQKKNAFQDKALTYLGKIYLEKEEWEKAQKYLLESLNISPSSQLTHECLADYYLAKEKPEQALLEAKICLELVPWSAKYHKLMGHAFLQQEKWEEAGYYFQKALELQPMDISPLPYMLTSRLQQYQVDKIHETPLLYNVYLVRFFLESNRYDLFRDQYQTLQQKFSPEEVTKIQKSNLDIKYFIRLLEDSPSASIQDVAISALSSKYSDPETLRLVRDKMIFYQKRPGQEKQKLLWEKLDEKIKSRRKKEERLQVQRLIIRFYLAKDSQALDEMQKRGRWGEILLRNVFQDTQESIPMRFFACRMLLTLGTPQGENMVKDYAETSKNFSGILLASVALKEVNALAAPDILLRGTKASEPYLRALCLPYLAPLYLEKMLNDDDDRVRVYAAGLLLEKSPKNISQRYLDILAENCLKNSTPFIRLYCLSKIWPKSSIFEEGELPPNYVEKYSHTLEKLAQDPHPLVRHSAILRIGSYRLNHLSSSLVPLFEDKEEMLRMQAVLSSLWISNHYDLMNKLVANEKESPSVRIAAALALLTRKNLEGLARIEKILNEKDPTLGLLVITFLSGFVEEQLVSAYYLQHARPEVKFAALNGIMFRGVYQNTKQIEDQIESPSPFLRQAASASLIRTTIRSELQHTNIAVDESKKMRELHERFRLSPPNIRKGAAFAYYFEIYYKTFTDFLRVKIDPNIIEAFDYTVHPRITDFLYELYFLKIYEKEIENPASQEFYLWCLNQAIDMFPQPRYYYERALIFEIQGQREEAIKDLYSAIKMSPQSDLYYTRLARLYLKVEKYLEVLQITNKITEKNPRSLEGWRYKLEAYRALGETEEVRKAYEHFKILSARGE